MIHSSITRCTMEAKNTKNFKYQRAEIRTWKLNVKTTGRGYDFPSLHEYKLRRCLIRTPWKEVFLKAHTQIVATQ